MRFHFIHKFNFPFAFLLADKIETLLKGDLKKMGSASRRMVEDRFLWSRIARQTLDAYRSLR